MSIKNHDAWTEFINNNKYSIYMKKITDVKIDNWYKNFELLKDFKKKMKEDLIIKIMMK